MKKRYCVIMAGGIGSRFWPVSRRSNPKQFLDIMGTGKSFIRLTYERFAGMIPTENFLVVTNDIYKSLVLEHIPELSENQVLCEPIGRNTAPCIAYAAWRIRSIDPEAVMVVTPADHLILNETEFRKVIEESIDFASNHDALMTIGIQPNRPDTGYGYIQVDQSKAINGSEIYPVKTFTEKPNLEMAKVFVESGEFFWNSGIFVWQVPSILKRLDQFLPDVQELFRSIESQYNTPSEQEAINTIYPKCRSISIDFGVMEKSPDVYVRRSEFGWSDVGTWGSLYQQLPKDRVGNIRSAKSITYETSGCIIKAHANKVVVIDGLQDYIVVDTEDALMICPKENEQNIKRFIDDVAEEIGDMHL